jgi:hypothetical protein
MPEPVVNLLGRAQDTLDGARSQEKQVQWGKKQLKTKKYVKLNGIHIDIFFMLFHEPTNLPLYRLIKNFIFWST